MGGDLPFLADADAPASVTRMSRPGCWAYPDMYSGGKSVMQATRMKEKGCKILSFIEERTLFANWAIVSSPLILSFDIANDTEVERMWPIIAKAQ